MALAPQPAAGDFGDLFREHAPALLRLIRSRIGDAEAADVLQETFLRFFRFYVVPGTLDPSRPPGPLLAVIATRESARHGHALRRQRQLEAAGPSVDADDTVGSDEHVAALHREPIVRAVLDRLDARQRHLLLQWESRRSTEALAAAEHVSVPALKQVVVRARRNFRDRYREFDGPAAVIGPLLLRLRARLRLDPGRYEMAATRVGLAACSAALLAVAGGTGPAPNRMDDVLPHAMAVYHPPPPDAAPFSPALEPPRQAVRGEAGTAVDTIGHPTVQRRPVSPMQTGADVAVTTDDPKGSTRSINSLTVQCEAGMTGTALCTVLDLAASGSRNS